jgi:beta-fructofuranosidase
MLLFFSHKRAGQYYVGDYDRATHRLTPDYHGRMNYGPLTVGSLHAPSATIDDRGRLVAFFNVKEGKEKDAWNDVMTLPRHLSLAVDGSLRIEPASETVGLRAGHASVGPMDIAANEEDAIQGVAGKAMEVEAVLEPGDAREVGLSVLRSPDGAEQTRISLFQQDHRRFGISSLQIDVSAASLRGDVFARTPEIGPITLAGGEALRLRVFVDRSIVEVFANERQCLTVRAYPQREDSNGVSVFARGGAAGVAGSLADA